MLWQCVSKCVGGPPHVTVIANRYTRWKKKKGLDMTVVCKVLLYIYYSGEARKCPFDFETVWFWMNSGAINRNITSLDLITRFVYINYLQGRRMHDYTWGSDSTSHNSLIPFLHGEFRKQTRQWWRFSLKIFYVEQINTSQDIYLPSLLTVDIFLYSYQSPHVQLIYFVY